MVTWAMPFEAWIHLANAHSRAAARPSVRSWSSKQAARHLADDASPQRVPLAREVATALMQLGKLIGRSNELATSASYCAGRRPRVRGSAGAGRSRPLAELQGREADAADALQEAERLMQRVGATRGNGEGAEPT